MEQLESYCCSRCGSVVEVQSRGEGVLFCCGEKMHTRISWLFLITDENAMLKSKGNYDSKNLSNHFIIDLNANLIAFSDRPNRQAKKIKGGLETFIKLYEDSDFVTTPPNATFVALDKETQQEYNTVFEMEIPFIHGDKLVIPIKTVIGDEVLPPYGSYIDVSFVIDDFFSSIIHKISHAVTKATDSVAHTLTHAANDVAHTATHAANDVARTATNVANDVANTATTLYNSAISDVEKGLKDVKQVAVKIENDVERGFEKLLKGIANNFEGDYRDTMKGIENAIKELSIESIIDAFKERNIEKLADVFIHLLKNQAESLIDILDGKTDTFLILQGTFQAGYISVGGNVSDGVGINLTKIREDLRSFVDGSFDIETLKQQIIDGSIVEYFVAAGASVGVDTGFSVDLSVGFSFGSSLDSQTIDFDVGATFEVGTDVTVSLSIPSDIFDVGGYTLGGITIAFDEGAKVELAMGVTYAKSISLGDFIGGKQTTQQETTQEKETTSSVCFFFKNSEYARVHLETGKTDNDYPKAISNGWSTLPWSDNIDTAINWGDGKIYFFKGDEYVRYDHKADKMDSGYPAKISKGWKTLPWFDNIDAIVNWGGGKAYFFKGDEYVRYDIAKDEMDDGYPAKISEGWKTLPWYNNIDAIINWGNGKAYFFKGNQYIRYDIAKDKMDDGYPLSIEGHWDNLPWSDDIDALMSW